MTISDIGSDNILLSQDYDTGIGTSSFIITVKDDNVYENEKFLVILLEDSPECGILLRILDNDGNNDNHKIFIRSDNYKSHDTAIAFNWNHHVLNVYEDDGVIEQLKIIKIGNNEPQITITVAIVYKSEPFEAIQGKIN